MNQYIAEILKCRIENMSFADKVGGLVMAVKTDINGAEKIYPVAANVKHNDCITGQYNDLMPNSKYKSVMYFEDLGIEFGVRNGDIQEFKSRLKLIAWLNLEKITDEKCPDSGAICAVLETINALTLKNQNYAPILSLFTEINQVTRDRSIFSEYTYDEKYSQFLFYPYDFFAITITVRAKINFACLCDANLQTGCYPAVPSIIKQICIDAESFDGTMIDGDCIRLKDFGDGAMYGNKNGSWEPIPAASNDHSSLDNLDFASSGHTGFEVEGAAALALVAANGYTDGQISGIDQSKWEPDGLTKIKPKSSKLVGVENLTSIIYDVTLSSNVPSIVVNLSNEQDIEVHIYGTHNGDTATGSFTINDIVSSNYILTSVLTTSFNYYIGRYAFSQIIRLKRDGNGFIYMENNAQQRYGTVSNPLNADRIIHGLLNIAQTGISKLTFGVPAGTNLLIGTNIKVRRIVQ